MEALLLNIPLKLNTQLPYPKEGDQPTCTYEFYPGFHDGDSNVSFNPPYQSSVSHPERPGTENPNPQLGLGTIDLCPRT